MLQRTLHIQIRQLGWNIALSQIIQTTITHQYERDNLNNPIIKRVEPSSKKLPMEEISRPLTLLNVKRIDRNSAQSFPENRRWNILQFILWS